MLWAREYIRRVAAKDFVCICFFLGRKLVYVCMPSDFRLSYRVLEKGELLLEPFDVLFCSMDMYSHNFSSSLCISLHYIFH